MDGIYKGIIDGWIQEKINKIDKLLLKPHQ